MKKLFAILICFAMMAGGVTGALAQSLTGDGTYDIAVKGNYTPNVGDVLSVTLEWEAMSFTYNATSGAPWNPFEHEYGAQTSAGWDSTKKKITVTNHSSTEINADVAFTSAEGVDIVGTFYSKSGDNFTALTSENSKQSLDTAVGTTLQNAPKHEYYFGVSGSGIDASKKLGSITVRISSSVEKRVAKIKNDIITAYNAGVRDITVNLPTEHPDLYTAIYDALAALDYINCYDTINLTINGAKTIPNEFIRDVKYGSAGSAIGQASASIYILESISLPDAETIGDSAFRYCRHLRSISLPKVKTIGESAFQGNNLTSIDLPKLETIGNYAFKDNPLYYVILPSVTSVGNGVFSYCSLLRTVTFGSPITSWGENVFVPMYDQTVFTPNITLTLAAGQMAFDQGPYGWTIQPYYVSAGDGASFGGYTFNQIVIAQ